MDTGNGYGERTRGKDTGKESDGNQGLKNFS